MGLLDSGRPRAALKVFRRLLRLRREDPDYPSNKASELEAVRPWLVRAHAAVLRKTQHTAAVSNRVGSSLTESELSRSPDKESNVYDHYRLLRCVVHYITCRRYA